MIKLKISNPGISLFTRYQGSEFLFILYDKNEYTPAFLEANKMEVFNAYEEDPTQERLNLSFIHHGVCSEQDEFNPLNISDMQVGKEVFNLDLASLDFTCSYDSYVTYIDRIERVGIDLFGRISSGYFPLMENDRIPKTLAEFNGLVKTSNRWLFDDWQQVDVDLELFKKVYEEAVDTFRLLDFFKEKNEEEYNQFWFHV